jgi:carbonic anhydrase
VSARDEILAANAAYAETFALASLTSRPIRRFAIVTCMDVRLDPVSFLGLAPGDAHVIRNAGGVVTDDALRSLVVSHTLMGAQEAFVIGHTNCGMQRFTDEDIRARVAQNVGADAARIEFLTFDDVAQSVRSGVRRIRESPYLPDSFEASGLVYDVSTGRLESVD